MLDRFVNTVDRIPRWVVAVFLVGYTQTNTRHDTRRSHLWWTCLYQTTHPTMAISRAVGMLRTTSCSGFRCSALTFPLMSPLVSLCNATPCRTCIMLSKSKSNNAKTTAHRRMPSGPSYRFTLITISIFHATIAPSKALLSLCKSTTRISSAMQLFGAHWRSTIMSGTQCLESVWWL